MSTLTIPQINKNNVVTIDFETYYGDNYSLTSKGINTSEYIRDPRFKVHIMGIKVGDNPTVVYKEHEIQEVLNSIDWSKHALLCQNTAFDGFILSEHYGIVPAVYLDTLSMGRALHGPNMRNNLDTMAKHYGFAGKVREKALSNTKNIRDLSEKPELLKSLSEYCADDVNDTHGIFWKMYDGLTDKELQLIDITIRAFCDPVLEVDLPRVQAELDKEIASKVSALIQSGMTADLLLSAEKFANELRKLGVEPPTKISKVTGKEAYAFASTDRGFIALRKHDNEKVRELVEARLLVKSTIGETRANRFLKAGENGAKLPVLLNYCGAHTFRWSGGNKMNLQNLVRGGELRRSILAPKDHVIVVADSAQIEARLNAWLSDENKLLDTFRLYDAGKGPDAYRIMASVIYGVPVDLISDEQRFVGKVCLAEGTMVLSNRGWVPIETITLEDKLWDGENWVCHSGLAMNGLKETLSVSGVNATKDHLILCGTEWKEAQYLAQDENILSQALVTGAESWRSLGTLWALAEESLGSLSSATAQTANTKLHATTSEASQVLDVANALLWQPEASDIGSTQMQCTMMHTDADYSIDLAQRLGDATKAAIKTTYTMDSAVSQSTGLGKKTGLSSSGMFKQSTDGTIQSSIWTEQMSTVTTNRVTYDLWNGLPMLVTNDESQTSKKKSVVYDILSVGPNNRFLALTTRGPIVVHNCVLALGYQMGENRLKETLELGAMGPPVILPPSEYIRAKNAYRFANQNIVRMWATAQRILHKMIVTQGDKIAYTHKCLTFGKDWVRLPNGMFLRYPGLRANILGDVTYDTLDGNAYIYGGLFVENLVQALARVIIADQMYQLQQLGYRIVTMTHDEIIIVCHKDDADKCKADMEKVMSTPPDWAPTLPLSVKCEYDTCYSK